MSEESQPKPIVVGYDGSAEARDALAAGLALARATSAPLVLAGAYGPDEVLSTDELEARGIEVGEQLLRADQYLPSGLPFPVERIPVPGVSAAGALQKLAEEMHPRAVVLGSSHRGTVGRVLAGSVGNGF